MNFCEQVPTFVWITVCVFYRLFYIPPIILSRCQPKVTSRRYLSSNRHITTAKILSHERARWATYCIICGIASSKGICGSFIEYELTLWFVRDHTVGYICLIKFTEPMRRYLISVDAPNLLIHLRSIIFPPCLWSGVNSSGEKPVSDIKTEWSWRSGFSSWSSLALNELLRDNGRPFPLLPSGAPAHLGF